MSVKVFILVQNNSDVQMHMCSALTVCDLCWIVLGISTALLFSHGQNFLLLQISQDFKEEQYTLET